MIKRTMSVLFLAIALTLLSLTISVSAVRSPAPTTFIVNTTADHDDGACDSNDCTLREAINNANSNIGKDTIAFNISGLAPHTIIPLSALPEIPWSPMTNDTTLRVARPTDKLDEVVRFYRDGLGLTELGSFSDHEEFDGVMLGVPGAPYHLEFTRKRGHTAGCAPTKDNLLVFYLPNQTEWLAAINRMLAAGYAPVPSFNPYWDRSGRTFEDPDGYRVVFQNAAWSP